MPIDGPAPDPDAIQNLSDFMAQMLPDTFGARPAPEQRRLIDCLVASWRGVAPAPATPAPRVATAASPGPQKVAGTVTAPVAAPAQPQRTEPAPSTAPSDSPSSESDTAFDDFNTVNEGVCQLLARVRCGIMPDGSLDPTMVEYTCGAWQGPGCELHVLGRSWCTYWLVQMLWTAGLMMTTRNSAVRFAILSFLYVA